MSMVSSTESKTYGVVVIGGGILGTTLAYWLSQLYNGEDVLVIEQASSVAAHTSSRNTGVIHRPFYLHPEKKKTFARTAGISYQLWKNYARGKGLPWNEVGTIEVALDEAQLEHLKQYAAWALDNGMSPEEAVLLSSEQVSDLEPQVQCRGALFCKTDTAVDFRSFTESLYQDAKAQGVTFLFDTSVENIKIQSDQVRLTYPNRGTISARLVINCAGGGALPLARAFGVAREYVDLNFRGEYWRVNPSVATLARHNIYSVPRHPEFPFLDPHWIVRWDGNVEIGPSAVPVFGAYAYRGLFQNSRALFQKLFQRPFRNLFRLWMNPEFLTLTAQEWRASLSRSVTVERVRRFLPTLKEADLTERGVAGVRSVLVDGQGKFVREALALAGPRSFHILNYNSPGATGAPAYTALMIKTMMDAHQLDHLQKKDATVSALGNFETIIQGFQ